MTDFNDIIDASARRYNVDPKLVNAVIQTESSGKPGAINTTGGGKGAYGPMQVRQAALADYNAANGTKYGMQDLLNPRIGVDVGTWYLGQQLDKFNDPNKALVAYNEGAASKNVETGSTPYVQKVMSQMAQPKKSALPGIPQGGDDIPDAFSQQYGYLLEGNKSGAASAASKPSATVAKGGDIPDYFSQQYGYLTGNDAGGKPSGGANPAATAQGQVTQPQSIVDVLKSVQAGKIAPQQLGMPTAGTTSAFGTGASDAYQGGQQLVAHGLAAISDKYAPEAKAKDAEIATREQAYQASRQGQTGVDWGRLAGNVASGVLMPGGAPASFAGKLGLGALQGGAFGALQPVADTANESYGTQKAGQVGYGMLGGAAAPAIANAVGGVIAPRLAEGANALREVGVKLTPGQALGGGFKALEDKLTSVPLLGDLIKNAQRGSVEDFNRAAYQRALDPIGEKVTAPVGREAIEQVSDKLSAAYNNLLPKMTFAADQQFQSDMANVAQVATGLAEPQFKQLGKILENDLLRHMTPQGTMNGESLKKVENALTQKAKTYQSSAVGSERELGDAISTVLQSVRSTLERSNPEYAAELAKINQGYANYARIRQAAAMTGAEHGIFTPAQLQNAVKATDKSVAKGNFAKGNALMQDLSEAGKSVIGNQYPDSGTAGRLIANGIVGSALGGGTMAGAINPAALVAGGIAAAPYTGFGRTAFNALLNRPAGAQAVSESVRKNLPRLLVPLTPAALTVGKQ